MQTEHEVIVGDARDLTLPADSVDLVVTSPPYPMVEMWDETLTALDPAIGDALDEGDGETAYERMHDVLDGVWRHLERVLRPGGIACVNVGDATRTLGEFRLYPNHVEITGRFRAHGFTVLPGILWRKPANSPSKFVGSGMLPTNAYPTQEHEHILLFRNGGTREFPPGDERRYESAYFWEERNEWFSDLWEVQGRSQRFSGEARDRSGAYPLEIPYRLISMFSIYTDTVLDPFWGTGTTSIAAMVAGRNSIGYELDEGFTETFDERLDGLSQLSYEWAAERLEAHRAFIRERRASGDPPAYQATNYDFPVVTGQERDLRLYAAQSVEKQDATYVVEHEPV